MLTDFFWSSSAQYFPVVQLGNITENMEFPKLLRLSTSLLFAILSKLFICSQNDQ